ncbi:ImpA family metalloprotease [Vibrio vulnificus]|uniref:ImpA family metalloprotease n=1 Tax=Vibrio vulnificus TaxID=672 RepID=UPI001A92641E|nr:ImpA family metalloprotease [Vibrio vulnificus]
MKVSDSVLSAEVDAALVVNLPMTPVDPDLVNHAPTIEALSTIKAVAGKTTKVSVTATDKDGDTLTYSLVNNPSWVSIQDNIISIAPSVANTGNHVFKVKVSDSVLSAEVDAALVVNLPMTPVDPDLVNHAPTIEALSTIKAVAGEAISVNVMAFDVDSDPIYFSLTENPVFVSINAESGLMTLTPDYFDSGSYQFTVVASDEKLETARKITVVVSENPVQKALETGEHSYATETQLLDFAVKQIEDDISVSVRILNKLYENLESGVTWHPSRNSQWITNYSASLNNNTRFMVGNRYENGNAANVTLGIVGEKPIGQRYAYTTGHPLVVDQNNTGIAQLMKNTFSWLTETKLDSDGKLNVVLVNQHTLYNNTVNWFNQNYPDAYTINTDKACDDGKLMSCLTDDVDLVIFANTGFSPEQEEAFTAAYDKMKKMNIPFYFASTTHHVHSPLLLHVIRDIGIISVDTNYWNKAQLVASSPSDILPTGEDTRVTFLNKMKERSFEPSILSSCGANYVYCTSSEFLDGFKNAADLLRRDVIYYDSSNTNVFELGQLELVKTTLLLADKYRSLIDYPIARSSEHEEFFKALFADWYVLYSRPKNVAQPDLGEYVIDKSLISKGTNAHYAYPETVTRSQINTVPYTKQWTSTGWYALPGKTVTLTRTGEDTHKVVVRLYYARNNTNRTYSDGWYNKHQDMTIGRFAIPPKGSVTFSTPYGAPIYLYHEGGSGGELSTEITATGVAEHPAVTDFTDPEQLKRFAELYNNTEIPHVDLKLANAEQHLRRDRFASAIGTIYPDVGALLKGIQEDHIETAYSLAGLKVDGKTLDESIATGAMTVCKSKFGVEDCTDENLHIRKIIQHANYDQNAQCGIGCAGNPWDSGAGISPRGWLDNHELGHNLQTSLLNASYVTEANRNDWTQYQSRAGENSNNIFPYYSAWKGYYLTDGHTGTIYDGHQDAKLTYYAYQSDIEDLRNVNGERVIYFPTCSVAAIGKTRHESIWAGNAYSENNGYRMAFYIQLALRADELKTLVDGSVLDTGWDIYPVLYQHARIYAKYARNESDWLANRDKLGFDLFEHAVNNSNVTRINGNDFMLVSLSYLTGYDWSTHFDVWGLRNSNLALQQAAKHGVKGKLPLGMYVHERDFPTANLSDGLDFLPLGEKGVKWTRDESTPVNCATK